MARACSKSALIGILTMGVATLAFAQLSRDDRPAEAWDRPIVHRGPTGTLGIYGRIMTGAGTPSDAALAALRGSKRTLGITTDDLAPYNPPGRGGNVVPMMGTRDRPKFWFVTFTQTASGLPVFDTRVGVLVGNAPGFPVVALKANTRSLDGLAISRPAVEEPNLAEAMKCGMAARPGVHSFASPRVGVWAGTDAAHTSARVAVEFYGDLDDDDRIRFIADASTGEILFSESVTCYADLTVNTSGLATLTGGANGWKTDDCTAESSFPLPWLAVTANSTTHYTDANGALVISGLTGSVSPSTEVNGLYFAIHRHTGGSDESLSDTVTVPATVNFVFNSTNSTQDYRSAVNAYRWAQKTYDFVAAHAPSIDQDGTCNAPFDIYVNRGTGAAYIAPNGDCVGAFVRLPGGSPSPACATIVAHEYGHHVINMAGYSGHTTYNEGMADTISMLVTDQPEFGAGIYDCDVPLRTAVNALTYPCADYSDEHTCGQLLSGCFWELRELLYADNASTYMDILAPLALNSIAMYVGPGKIDPSVFLDVLTLDDDNADLCDGTPHGGMIYTAFAAHRMTIANFTGDASCLQHGPLKFEFSQTLPTSALPGETTNVTVTVSGLYGNTPEDDAAWLYVDSTGDGDFTEYELTRTAANQYTAAIVAPGEGGSAIRYYLRAQTDEELDSVYPPGAPDRCITLTATSRMTPLATYTFNDSSLSGWSLSHTNCFQSAPPQIGATANSSLLPPTGPDLGMTTLLNGQPFPGNSQVSVTSPAVDTTGCDGVRVSYARWFKERGALLDADDYVRLQVSYDNGSNWSTLEQVGPGGADAGGGWRYKWFPLTPSAETKLRVVHNMVDAGEAGNTAMISFDNVEISSFKGCPSDFDNNGFVNGADYDAFLDAFGNGEPCADFDGDTFVTGDDFDDYADAFIAGC